MPNSASIEFFAPTSRTVTPDRDRQARDAASLGVEESDGAFSRFLAAADADRSRAARATELRRPAREELVEEDDEDSSSLEGESSATSEMPAADGASLTQQVLGVPLLSQDIPARADELANGDLSVQPVALHSDARGEVAVVAFSGTPATTTSTDAAEHLQLSSLPTAAPVDEAGIASSNHVSNETPASVIAVATPVGDVQQTNGPFEAAVVTGQARPIDKPELASSMTSNSAVEDGGPATGAHQPEAITPLLDSEMGAGPNGSQKVKSDANGSAANGAAPGGSTVRPAVSGAGGPGSDLNLHPSFKPVVQQAGSLPQPLQGSAAENTFADVRPENAEPITRIASMERSTMTSPAREVSAFSAAVTSALEEGERGENSPSEQGFAQPRDGNTPSSDAAGAARAGAASSSPTAFSEEIRTRATTPQPLDVEERMRVVEQVRRRIEALHLTNGRQEVTLRLNPDHLGEVRLTILLEQNVVSARFMAETEAARQAMADGRESLRAALEQKGYSLQSLDVGTLTGRDAGLNQHQPAAWAFSAGDNRRQGNGHTSGRSGRRGAESAPQSVSGIAEEKQYRRDGRRLDTRV